MADEKDNNLNNDKEVDKKEETTENKGIIYKLQGRGGCGKTTTLNYVIDFLIEKYGEAIVDEKNLVKHENGDRQLVMIVKTESGKTVRVGVETMGDLKTGVAKSLEYFKKFGCDIIFCAASTTKNKVTAEENAVIAVIDSYKEWYIIKEYKKEKKFKDKKEQDNENKELAKKMIENASL